MEFLLAQGPRLLRIIAALILGVWLFLLVRRIRSVALWWLFVLLGPWPIICLVVTPRIYDLLGRWLPNSDAGAIQFAFVSIIVSLSILAVTFALQCVVVMKVAALARTERTQSQPLCPRCGYNLTGLEQDRCPECGTSFICEVRYITRTA